jgi:hypothetical protein
MISFDVNWLAILVSIVANMIIGATWYGVFAEPWLEGIGKTREEVQQEQSPRAYAVAVLNSLFMAFVLANVLRWAGAVSLVDGLLVAFFMWLGFTGFTFAANHAFEFRGLKLWLVNSVIYLVGLLVMGAILTLWV